MFQSILHADVNGTLSNPAELAAFSNKGSNNAATMLSVLSSRFMSRYLDGAKPGTWLTPSSRFLS